MKRIMLTITLLMAFGLTVHAGHHRVVTTPENLAAQPQTVLAHHGGPLHGHHQ